MLWLTDGSSACDPEIAIAAGEIAAFIKTPELMSGCARKTVEGLRCGADRPALVAVVVIVLNVVVPDRDH